MGKANKALLEYVKGCLNRGYSFLKIEKDLVNRGYTRRVAEGIILKYKYRGNVFKWLTVVSLSSLFVLSLFLGGSGIIGMATVSYKASYENTLNVVANESSSYTWYPIPKGELVSVSITGNLIGSGTAKVYIENMGNRYLIFDSLEEKLGVTVISSSVIGQKIKRFEDVCVESCELKSFNKSVYSLVFELDDSIIEVEKVYFDLMVGTEIESVPAWSEIEDLKVSVGSELKINLDSFFNATEDRIVFTTLSQDDSMDIDIKSRVATIKPGRTGKYHIYFIAYVNGIKFVSSLIEINVVNEVYEQDVKTIVTGPVNDLAGNVVGIGKGTPSKFTPFLLAIALLIVATLAVIPSRFYDVTNLALKIDNMRKTGKISSSIKTYNAMKVKLKRKDMSDAERGRLVDKLEKQIKSISRSVPKLKILREFNEKCGDLDQAIVSKSKGVENIYGDLRKIYLKVIEGKVRDKDKKIIYQKMQKYYKKIKK